MFGKLKEKLKQAVSIFSKKTEEEAVEEKVIAKPVEKAVKEKVVEEKKEKVIQTKKEKSKDSKKKKGKAKQKKEKIKETSEEIGDLVETESDSEETEEEKQEAEPEQEEIKKIVEQDSEEEKKDEQKIEVIDIPEKKSLFKRLFGKKEETETEDKESVEKTEEAEEKESFFGKVRTTLTTKKISAEKFEELFWDLELALLENNVSVEVIEKVKEDLKAELVDKPLPRDVPKKIEETLKQTLTEILSFEKVDLLERAKDKKPLVIAVFGINGTGKTTSIAKLAHYFQKNELSVVLAACDTFRAAAIQQLEEHAEKLGVKIIKQDYGSDAAAVAFDAIKYAEKNDIDIVLLDTAGRLHSNTNLMQELGKIIRIAKPDLKIFVGESITGNDCIEQAKKFNDLVEMDGAILTKADVDEKGGASISISYTIKKPILFLGIGQKYDDLEEFDAAVILKRLGF